MKYYYFDNAATSWPKPRTVIKAMHYYFSKGGGNPGRSGHKRAVEAGRVVLKTRELLAELFHIKDSSRIVMTKNATEALNIAILGFIEKGDHIVTTSMEHNSVMRPLTYLKNRGVAVSIADAGPSGKVTLDIIKKVVRENTRLLICTHASNVTGIINNIEEIGRFCSQRDIRFLVDAAQTVGVVPIDVGKMDIDFLAFSGHKGLLGPQGTGGLFIREGIDLNPIVMGGTGSVSDREVQPDFLPDRFESGTLNVIGIAGLCEGVKFILQKGIHDIIEHDRKLLHIFLNEIARKRKITVYGPSNMMEQTGVLSVNILGISPSKVGEILDREYRIMTRIGLHCAPRAHKTIGTFPDGTVRFSWGIFTKERDILVATRALNKIEESIS
jgi:cysteine desulfurase/selenocysteine lyase